ncbi:hypothetical protein PHMEG_00032058 [Phytophthora megakarya]|uniref:DUF659 domain-containing protein n=1 Tax=Phytophthora megakarya TaxID=4795 RepID=A0A225UWH5_9STRA|nr:hypothetical protein PHMEG_00032058 [Phytophthora megakarya]
MAPPQHEIWCMFTVALRVLRVKSSILMLVVLRAKQSSRMHNRQEICSGTYFKSTSVDVESRVRCTRYDAQRRWKKASKLLTPCQPTQNSATKTPSVTKRLFSTPQRSATQEPPFQEVFDYKLPSRRQLSGRLLCAAYDREKERVIGLLTGMTELALVTDGWSNTNGDGIINFVFVNPKTPVIFWNSMDSKAESHTGRYIADIILSPILELDDVIGAGVVTAVVTDNAANMKKTHGSWLQGSDRELYFKLDYFKQVLEKALTLARFIKHRRGLWSRFRDTQKQLKQQGVKRRRLSLTVATRWYTHEKCIRNVFQNRDVIAAIFADTAFIDSYAGAQLDEATAIFKDESFWKRARIALDLIQPINTSSAAFERDDSSISLVYQQFEWLRKHSVYTKRLESCEPELQQLTLNAIENRRKKI